MFRGHRSDSKTGHVNVEGAMTQRPSRRIDICGLRNRNLLKRGLSAIGPTWSTYGTTLFLRSSV